MKKTFLFFILLLVSYSNYAQIDFQLLWSVYNDNFLITYSPDGNNVLSTDGNGILRMHDANNGWQVWAKTDIYDGFSFSPDGSKVVCIVDGFDLSIFNRFTGAVIWKDTSLNYSEFVISPNNNFIIAGNNNTSKLFNLNNGNIIWTKNESSHFDISFDNTKISYWVYHPGITPDSVIIADLITGNQIWVLPSSSYPKRNGFSPDNNFFTINSGAVIKIFNCNTGALVSTLPNDAGEFIRYSADNLRLFSFNDGSLFVYNTATNLLNCVISNPWFILQTLNFISFDSSGNTVVFGGETGFGVFNTNNGVLIGSDNVAQQFTSIPNSLSEVIPILSPDGSRVFSTQEESVDGSRTAKMWATGITGTPNIESKKPNYKIYPNPVNENLFIEIQSQKNAARIELLDLQGRQLKIIYSVEKKYSIDLSCISSGAYLLKIFYDDGEIDLKKIIKQ